MPLPSGPAARAREFGLSVESRCGRTFSVKLKEGLLILADLMHADVVVASLRIRRDALDVRGRVRAARHRASDAGTAWYRGCSPTHGPGRPRQSGFGGLARPDSRHLAVVASLEIRPTSRLTQLLRARAASGARHHRDADEGGRQKNSFRVHDHAPFLLVLRFGSLKHLAMSRVSYRPRLREYARCE